MFNYPLDMTVVIVSRALSIATAAVNAKAEYLKAQVCLERARTEAESQKYQAKMLKGSNNAV